MVKRKPAESTVQVLFHGVEAEKDLPPEQKPVEVTVPMADIRNFPKPEELRRTPEEMQELVDGIATAGLRKRAEFIALPDGGWLIHKGRHRSYALHMLGRTEVPGLRLPPKSQEELAVDRIIDNTQQVKSTPWEQCEEYRAALLDDQGKPRMSTKLLAKAVGVSEAVLLARLALWGLGPDLGRRAGIDITLEAVEALLPLAKHPDLLAQVAKALPDRKKVAKQSRPYLSLHDVCDTATKTLTKGAKAPGVTLFGGELGEHQDVHSAAVQKALGKLPQVKVGHAVIILDPPAVRAAVEEARDQRIQREKAAKRKGRSNDPAKQKARVDRRTRLLQVSVMAKHVHTRPSWGDELTKAVYRHFLGRAVGPATKAERQALQDAVGLPDLGERFDAKLVDQLWDKDRLTLDRILAVAIFLASKDYTGKVVRNDAVAVLTTGMTAAQAQDAALKEMAREASAVPSKRRASPPKQKDGGEEDGDPAAGDSEREEPAEDDTLAAEASSDLGTGLEEPVPA